MRGHEKIIELRKRGVRPAHVFLNDFPCSTEWETFADHATVCVDGDDPDLLDLRFLVGTVAHVACLSQARADRFMGACRRAGCSIVAVTASDRQNGYWQTGYLDIWPGVRQAQKEDANG